MNDHSKTKHITYSQKTSHQSIIQYFIIKSKSHDITSISKPTLKKINHEDNFDHITAGIITTAPHLSQPH
jgi:hypothetical protein